MIQTQKEERRPIKVKHCQWQKVLSIKNIKLSNDFKTWKAWKLKLFKHTFKIQNNFLKKNKRSEESTNQKFNPRKKVLQNIKTTFFYNLKNVKNSKFLEEFGCSSSTSEKQFKSTKYLECILPFKNEVLKIDKNLSF